MSDKIFILKNSTHTNEQQRFEVLDDFNVYQDEMNGLNQLINWLEGYKSAKGGTIPGEFELVMFHRRIIAHFYDQRNKTKENGHS